MSAIPPVPSIQDIQPVPGRNVGIQTRPSGPAPPPGMGSHLGGTSVDPTQTQSGGGPAPNPQYPVGDIAEGGGSWEKTAQQFAAFFGKFKPFSIYMIIAGAAMIALPYIPVIKSKIPGPRNFMMGGIALLVFGVFLKYGSSKLHIPIAP